MAATMYDSNTAADALVFIQIHHYFLQKIQTVFQLRLVEAQYRIGFLYGAVFRALCVC